MAAPNQLHPDLAAEAAPYNQAEHMTFEAMKRELGQSIVGLPPTMITRFIRGYSKEPNPTQAAIDKLRETLKWRAEFKVDELHDKRLDKDELFRKYWPGGMHGFSKQGRPIYVERIGKIDPPGLTTNFDMDAMLKFHVQMMERLTRSKDDLSRQLGRSLYKHVVILDLEGLGYAHMGNQFFEPMKKFVNIDQYYYPECLHKMIIVNAPWIFKMAWKIVRPWLHPLTRERIQMGHEHLLENIDEDQIPRFLGGKCQCPGGKCLEVPFMSGKIGAVELKRDPPPAQKETTPQPPEVNFDPASVSESTDEIVRPEDVDRFIEKEKAKAPPSQQ